MKQSALRFVVLMGIVNLFADMAYEGGRGVTGAFLGSLGASGFVVGAVAGGGELVGYAVRGIAGLIADRTGKYWLDAWVGYFFNLFCIPALAFAGNWPLAAGLVIGERFGRGVRRPVTSGLIAEAGNVLGGRGRAFGLNEALDQTGATIGPLIVATVIAKTGSYHAGFGTLVIPAVLALVALAFAQHASKGLIPSMPRATTLRDPATFRRYAIGGALIAAGYVDFALIALRFARDHVMSAASISLWFAVAMAVAAIASYFLGDLLDRHGTTVVVVSIVITAAASPLVFMTTGGLAELGVALWGLGTAVQDVILIALVARVIGERRATAFGIYDTIFGVAWFAGSALAGYLVDHSIAGLVVFSVIAQLAAIPFFAMRPRQPSLH